MGIHAHGPGENQLPEPPRTKGVSAHLSSRAFNNVLCSCPDPGESCQIDGGTGLMGRRLPLKLTLAHADAEFCSMNPSLMNCTAQQLRRAADLQEKIESLEQQLGEILGTTGSASEGLVLQPKRRFSAATIAKMRASQQARWAANRGTDAAATSTPKRRRRMSPAAKARLSAVAKARWKKARAAGKSRL